MVRLVQKIGYKGYPDFQRSLRGQVEAMLVSLGEAEARAAVEAGQGEASIHCEFCGSEYRFNGDEVGVLFRDAAAELPAAAGIQ